MPEFELLSDEHHVPTQLNERVPIFGFLWPFDWTIRQVYWFVLCLWMGMTAVPGFHNWAEFWTFMGYVGLGLFGVAIEYVIHPTPEFWLSVYSEYLGVLLVSLPMWWKRLLPLRGGIQAADWPLATMPQWFGHRLVANVEVLNDGILRLPARFGRKPHFALAIEVRPLPHPDLMPMIVREAIIQSRLSIFKLIRGEWSLHLQVRPFDLDALEVASGPAWDWISEHLADRMVKRRPVLVLYADKSEELPGKAASLLDGLRQARMYARRQTRAEARALVADLWSDLGVLSTGRVRIGVKRVVAGLRSYRSWVVTVLPEVIHLSWLRPLASESLLCDIAIHVNRRPPGATLRSLQRRIRQWHAVERGRDYELAVEDAENMLASMRRGLDTEITMGMYVTARTEQAVKVSEALDRTSAISAPANAYQHRALRATRALGGDPVNRKIHADLRTIATTDLFATAGYFPAGATLIGEALSAPEPIGLNLFDEDSENGNINWSMFIAMMMGAGKTTTGEVLAYRLARPHRRHVLYGTGVTIVSVDFKPSGDYEQLYRELDRAGQKASYNSWSGTLPPIDGHMGFNLSDVPEPEHGKRLLELMQRLEEWSASNSIHRPMLLLVDEVLAILEAAGGASLLRRLGTQSRSSNMGVIFMSQDIEEVLKNKRAGIAFKNCSHVFVGRHTPAGINAMTPLLDLEKEARLLIASAPQGAGLLRIERRDGSRMLGVQVRPTDWERATFGTNPSERRARWQKEQGVSLSGGKEHDDEYTQGSPLRYSYAPDSEPGCEVDGSRTAHADGVRGLDSGDILHSWLDREDRHSLNGSTGG